MLEYLSDLLTAFSVAFRTIRSRNDGARRLRERIGELNIEVRQLREAVAARTQERDALTRAADQAKADLDVAKREINGVTRAHENLVKMLAAQTALNTAKATRHELAAGK